MKGTSTLLILTVAIIFSCQTEENLPDSGSLELSNYVSIGNSLTAGYTNNGLYREGQINSYPNILAQQFSLVAELDFRQPLMPEGNGSGYIDLISYTSGSFPVIEVINPDPMAYSKIEGPFDNLGIPGLRVKDINIKEYGQQDLNRFFYRIIPSRSENSTSYMDIISQKETDFFTCWLGNNDILGYALEGGFYGEEGHGTYGREGLTDSTLFRNNYDQLLAVLVSENTKGILFTIPDISLIPYFNIVTEELFPGISDSKADELNDIWSDYNESIEKHNQIVDSNEELTESEKSKLKREKVIFSGEGQNRFVVEDQALPDLLTGESLPKARHLREGEMITIAGGQQILNFSEPAGIEKALGDRYVLTNEEIITIRSYLNSYNSSIESLAGKYGLEIIDSNSLLQEFVSGKVINGVELSTEYIEGGLFSLDATHLTPRGNAVIANEVIQVLNGKFKASIPQVSITNFDGVIP